MDEEVSESDMEQLRVCQRYFFAGMCLLPFLLFVNAYKFSAQADTIQNELYRGKVRFYARLSLSVALVYCVAILSWNVIFHTLRSTMGETGDLMTVNIPYAKL